MDSQECKDSCPFHKLQNTALQSKQVAPMSMAWHATADRWFVTRVISVLSIARPNGIKFDLYGRAVALVSKTKEPSSRYLLATFGVSSPPSSLNKVAKSSL